MLKIDTTKSLEELENDYWEERDTYETSLVETIYRIRKKSLDQLTPGDIRYFIGQNLGNDYIVSLALNLLEENPYVLGTYYEGDLLMGILHIEIEFWMDHKKLLNRLIGIMDNVNRNFTEEIEELIPDFIKNEINYNWKELLKRTVKTYNNAKNI